MNDFFGYTRSNPGQYIMSSDYAAIYMANNADDNTAPANRLGLAQTCNVAYAHRVNSVFEAGSSELYWLVGQSQGNIAISRLVGSRFLRGMQGLTQPANNQAGGIQRQGAIGHIDFKIGKVEISQDVISFGGCVVESVGWGTSVAGMDISETVSLKTAILFPINLNA